MSENNTSNPLTLIRLAKNRCEVAYSRFQEGDKRQTEIFLVHAKNAIEEALRAIETGS